jgi:putative Mg2+ transporter-C (MgtC) family protein
MDTSVLLPPMALEIVSRLVLAVVLGLGVGIDRTLRGRPAGFRTHALVSLSSCLLMLITVYEEHWFPEAAQARVTIDPTRMAQGVMTGIGFIGAGAILREGVTVRGLTTAASVWTTAALGLLVGIGFFFPAILGAMLAILMLSAFRLLEDRIPTYFHARLSIRSDARKPFDEKRQRDRLAEHGLAVASVSRRTEEGSELFVYGVTLRARQVDSIDQFAARFAKLPEIVEYEVSPVYD